MPPGTELKMALYCCQGKMHLRTCESCYVELCIKNKTTHADGPVQSDGYLNLQCIVFYSLVIILISKVIICITGSC